MLLTITTTYSPASDLGYLLHKHPERVQTFELAFGKAHVFYPEVSAAHCTAALLLDMNPVGLVRGAGRDGGMSGLEEYVNDRSYVASSFMSVAIAQVYGSALAGKCEDRPELVEMPIPLEAKIAALPCRGGEAMLRRLFEPLGYTLTVERQPLDTAFPDWGDSRYFTVTLAITARLKDLLAHLYVLIPVLDDEKHYYVGGDEVDKLLKRGEGWLASHPAQALIAERYLKHQRSLKRAALERLTADDQPQVEEEAVQRDAEEEAVEAVVSHDDKMSLHEQRLGAALAVLKNSGARRVLDLGCGEGRLLSMLLKEAQFSEILGMDVSHRVLDIAADRLHLDRLTPAQQARLKLIHGSLMYRDPRLSGYDAAAVIEVIEHLDPPRLAAFERCLFEFARPGLTVITTPNAEYNVKWESLPAGKFRHRDHRFEWTRAEFEAWAKAIAARFGYNVRFLPVGPEDAVVGAPSQMGIFESHERNNPATD